MPSSTRPSSSSARSSSRTRALLAALSVAAVGCGRPAPPGEPTASAPGAPAASASVVAEAPAIRSASSLDRPTPPIAPAPAASPPLPADARACRGHGDVECVQFPDATAAFRWILAHEPLVLAIGEAHAQKGTEAIASAAKRFTDTMVPALQGRASDLLLEAWAGDPSCKQEVKQVAKAHAPVKEAQAATNPNEYIEMGTRAKSLGVQPHLLRPTCADYTALAEAGDDVITASLALIKRLTLADVQTLYGRNTAARNGKLVVTYGGAMHNDLAPSDALRAYSFGPELLERTGGRYVELDLIVAEYVKTNDVWRKLPWFAAWEAEPPAKDKATLYRLGPRSFAVLFPRS